MAKKKKTASPPVAYPEGKGLLCLCAAFLLLVSLFSFSQGRNTHSILGILGVTTGFLLHYLFGLSSYIVCLFLGWIGWRLTFNKSINQLPLKCLYISVWVTSNSFLLSVIETDLPSLSRGLKGIFFPALLKPSFPYHLGGAPFYYLYRDLPIFNLAHVINWLGAALIFGALWLASVLFLFKISPWKIVHLCASLLIKVKEVLFSFFTREFRLEAATETEAPQEAVLPKPIKLRPPIQFNEVETVPEKPKEAEKSPKLKVELPKKEPAPLNSPPSPIEGASYQPPSLGLLTNAKKVDNTALKSNLEHQAGVLEQTLQSFGIEAKVGQINCGPTITSFEVHPSIGVKVQKIKTLEHDIALNMEAKSIRIIAPIPGKAAVGIEVPNAQPQEVGFKELLTAYQQTSLKMRIPVLLGRAVNGDPVISDLAKWPHGIIAGATGSGKSVCINTLIMSILYYSSPDQVRLLMVDPKKVELTPYSSLPHMIAPVITEPREACAALNWLVREMEKRYEILKITGSRNIDAFNSRKIDKEFESSLDVEIPTKLPYMVGIIDELADLMMVSSSDIETPIARIAQMARAVGIHLVLATQRPSREVITGLIKANFPTRIAFKVASRVNSQIILDETGAETLLGNGDMLFLPPGSSHLIRAQGSYIRDEDIAAVIKHITEQAPPNYLIPSFNSVAWSEDTNDDSEEKDPLYAQALDIVLGSGNASTTFLQRKLKIGYAKAASLIDELESNGVVGPSEGAKPRKILISRGNTAKESSPEEEFI